MIELFNREGADARFTRKAPSDYLPRHVKCEVCGCSELIPEKDILDVWWKSACRIRASAATVPRPRHTTFPADMYLEGSDQHRGWFQSSLLTSHRAPTACRRTGRSCTAGSRVDGEGRKMSKSLGNGIDPEMWRRRARRAAPLGGLLRLLPGRVHLREHPEAQERRPTVASAIPSASCSGNLNDFAAGRRRGGLGRAGADRPVGDGAHARICSPTWRPLTSPSFQQYYHAAYDYRERHLRRVHRTSRRIACTLRRRTRRAAGPCRPCSHEHPRSARARAGAHPVVHYRRGVECYPPTFRDIEGREASVQLAGWPTARDFVPALPADAGAQVATMEEMMAVREVVTKALEEARNEKIIGKSQEASLTVTAPAALVATAGSFDPSVFEELFIVASVQFRKATATRSRRRSRWPRARSARAAGTSASSVATRVIRTCASAAGTRWTPSRAGPSKWPFPRR